MMKISDIRTFKLNNSNNCAGCGSFTLDDTISLSFFIKNGPTGMFVAFPSRKSNKIDPKTGKIKWYSNVFIKDKDLREAVNKEVLNHFKNAENASSTNNGTNNDTNSVNNNYDNLNDEDIPF